MTVLRLGKIVLGMALVLSSVAASAGTTTHRVSKGDTLWDIAKKYHSTPKQVAQANGIKEDSTLPLGKVLRIPTKSTGSKSASSTKSAKKTASAAQSTAKAETKANVSTSGSQDLITYALACRGSRYRRGGVSRSGFDCSGFTRHVFARYGILLPHSSAAQARMGASVSKGDLRPADLVFFQTYRRGISHVGIYIGNGQFVHAATYGRGVRVDSLGSGYYASRYRGARRVK